MDGGTRTRDSHRGDDNEKHEKIEKRKRQDRNNMIKIVVLFTLIGIAQFVALVWYTMEDNGPESSHNFQSQVHEHQTRLHGSPNENIQQTDAPKNNYNQRSRLEQEEEDERDEHQNAEEQEHEKEPEQTNKPSNDNTNDIPFELLPIPALEEQWVKYDSLIRKRRKIVDIFEMDPEGQRLAKVFQEITRQLLRKRYGIHELYRVVIQLKFQESAPDFVERGGHGKIVLEMGPSEHIPLSVYTFLEISRKYNTKGKTGGGFHKRAGDILQAHVDHPDYKPLAFQEYSDAFPHSERTVGFAGRPSGPGWYISIEDNQKKNGPGSQQKENPYEADACFGKVVKEYDAVVLKRIKLLPCDNEGFCKNPKDEIKIMAMNIKVPDPDHKAIELTHDEDGYVFWKEK